MSQNQPTAQSSSFSRIPTTSSQQLATRGVSSYPNTQYGQASSPSVHSQPGYLRFEDSNRAETPTNIVYGHGSSAQVVSEVRGEGSVVRDGLVVSQSGRVIEGEARSRVLHGKKMKTQMIEVPVVHHEIRVPVEVEVPVEVPVRVPYEVPVPYEVIKEVPFDVEKVVHIQVPRKYPVDVPVPYPVQRVVERFEEKIVHVPGRTKFVEKVIEVEKEVEVEIPIERIHKIPVPYPVEKFVETNVKVPYTVEKIVHVPVERIIEKHVPIDKMVEVVKTKPVPYPVERVVNIRVPVPYDEICERRVPITVEKVVEIVERVEVTRVVEVPVEKIVETVMHKPVPFERIVEKRISVPVEKVVEIPVPRYVQKMVEKVVEIPYEKVVERIVEVPFEKVVHVPIDRVIERRIPITVERMIEKIVHIPVEMQGRDQPFIHEAGGVYLYNTAPVPPSPPPKFKWIPFNAVSYDQYLHTQGAHFGATADTDGRLNIIDRYIFVDPNGNVVDEKADMWTEEGLDPLTMQEKIQSAQRAGFHKSDRFWEQHFDDLAYNAHIQGGNLVDSQHFDHPVALQFHAGKYFPNNTRTIAA